MYNTYLFFIDGGVGRIFSGVGGDARRREDVIDDRVFVKRMQGKYLPSDDGLNPFTELVRRYKILTFHTSTVYAFRICLQVPDIAIWS